MHRSLGFSIIDAGCRKKYFTKLTDMRSIHMVSQLKFLRSDFSPPIYVARRTSPRKGGKGEGSIDSLQIDPHPHLSKHQKPEKHSVRVEADSHYDLPSSCQHLDSRPHIRWQDAPSRCQRTLHVARIDNAISHRARIQYRFYKKHVHIVIRHVMWHP